VTRDEIRRTVVAELARIAPEVAPGSLRPSAPLRDQIDLDSMDFLNFVVALHERFGVDIPEADYAQLSTLEAIESYVASRRDASRVTS
jgi:acyl carrier protein